MKLKRNNFFWVLLKMNMLPLILLTVVITTFSAVRFASSMNVETKNGLVNLCHTIVTLYDTVYERDYHIEDEGNAVYLMKGEHLVDGDFSIIDAIKVKTSVDITIFNHDTRVIATVETGDGVRATGTKANSMVVENVLKGGHPHFYSSTMVAGIRYFSYYEPILASNGKCIGMIFVGKPSEEVERLVYDSIKPIIVFGILTGLYNRRSGEKLLQQTCENYRKEGRPFCVAIGDIDHFKNVNDTYGHECGDVALAKISERIKEHMEGKGFEPSALLMAIRPLLLR